MVVDIEGSQVTGEVVATDTVKIEATQEIETETEEAEVEEDEIEVVADPDLIHTHHIHLLVHLHLHLADHLNQLVEVEVETEDIIEVHQEVPTVLHHLPHQDLGRDGQTRQSHHRHHIRQERDLHPQSQKLLKEVNQKILSDSLCN